ncbi:hypothetical protein O0L34_g14802 [Tuta absoluta]|nr:hypothetical protein O0L34_g14802 [Tuta absoluta]
MALWDCVELPFYFMDEFDVFMVSFVGLYNVTPLCYHLLTVRRREIVFNILLVYTTSLRYATTSSLSGGERSYSTVAFIMALWDCVELPFYFMDEFDVFMDDVNRKIVLKLLIEHACNNTSRQFVFLTPQDAADAAVTAAPRISIHRMPDPRP